MDEMRNALRRSEEEGIERERQFVPFARRTRNSVELAAERKRELRQLRPVSLEPRTPDSPVVTPSPAAPTPECRPQDASFFTDSAPLIAIPRRKSDFWQPRCVALENGGIDAESFRHLAVRVTRELAERKVNTLLVTSPVRGEGKTTVACNLALALASLSAGKPVALVDLDLKAPDLAAVMNVNVGNGIETVLRGENSLASRRARTDHHALDLFLAGTPLPNVHDLLSSSGTAAAIDEMSTRYQTVIIDSPPVISAHDASLLMSFVGGCLPVVKRGFTRRTALEEALALLPRESSIGIFFNHCASARYRRNRA